MWCVWGWGTASPPAAWSGPCAAATDCAAAARSYGGTEQRRRGSAVFPSRERGTPGVARRGRRACGRRRRGGGGGPEAGTPTAPSPSDWDMYKRSFGLEPASSESRGRARPSCRGRDRARRSTRWPFQLVIRVVDPAALRPSQAGPGLWAGLRRTDRGRSGLCLAGARAISRGRARVGRAKPAEGISCTRG